MTFCSVYVTASDRDEAVRIGRTLVEDRLAACANVIDGARSLYRWEGEVRDDPEAVVILKSRAELMDALASRVREIHSYDVPCIVSWPILDGDAEYLSWLAAEMDAAPE